MKVSVWVPVQYPSLVPNRDRLIMNPTYNIPDRGAIWLGRLQQDCDGCVCFIEGSFRLILWHYRGWMWSRGLFLKHKSSTYRMIKFSIWPTLFFRKETNDVCLDWPRNVITFTMFISHLSSPDSGGAAVGASLYQPSTLPSGIHAINTSILSSYVHPSICLHHFLQTFSSFTAWMG